MYALYAISLTAQMFIMIIKYALIAQVRNKMKIIHLKLKVFLMNILGANIKLSLGKHIRLDTHARIELHRNSTLEIGSNLYLGRFGEIKVYNGAKLTIGNNTHFSQGSIISCNKEISISDYSIFAPYVMIVDADHTNNKGNYIESDLCKKPINIGKNVWVGVHGAILKGSTIWDNTVIGANNFTSNEVIPDNIIYKRNGRSAINDI